MDITPTIQHIHGRILSITGTDPAPNTEIAIIVPARRRWKLISIRFSLVTDVNVADRRVDLVIDDGAIALYIYPSNITQPASSTRNYQYVKSFLAQFLIVNDFTIPFPDFMLAPGYRLLTVTTNIQAGDNYGAPQLLVEEWIDP